MQRALLLIAHGSRLDAANDEVRALSRRVDAVAGNRFDAVDCAFLELAEPSIPDGIQRLVAGGADDITVLPYFLAAGRHISEDIPAQVDAKRSEHPEVAITLAPYFGTAEAIPRLLLSLVA